MKSSTKPAKVAKDEPKVCLSKTIVKALGLKTNKAVLVSKNTVETTVKVNDKEIVVGNEEVRHG